MSEDIFINVVLWSDDWEQWVDRIKNCREKRFKYLNVKNNYTTNYIILSTN